MTSRSSFQHGGRVRQECVVAEVFPRVKKKQKKSGRGDVTQVLNGWRNNEFCDRRNLNDRSWIRKNFREH